MSSPYVTVGKQDVHLRHKLEMARLGEHLSKFHREINHPESAEKNHYEPIQ
jgi:hypothetical protein